MIVNATIQVVPLATTDKAFPLIDKVILLIQNSGVEYTVGAFETTLEGEYERVQQLLRQAEDLCYAEKNTQFLIYSKLHVCGGQDILIKDKTAPFNTDTDFSL